MVNLLIHSNKYDLYEIQLLRSGLSESLGAGGLLAALSLSLRRLSPTGSSQELLEAVLLLLLRDLDRAEPSLLASVSRTSLDSLL